VFGLGPRRRLRAATDVSELLARGNRCLEAGDVQGASGHYAAAMAADPSSADACVNFAFACIEQGRIGEALEPLRRAVELAPASVDARYLLGSSLLDLGHPGEALSHLDRATKLQPGLARAWRDAGRALAGTGRLAEAEALLRAGIEQHPRDPDLHHHLGNVLSLMRRPWDAAESYEAALAVDPAHAGALTSLAPARLAIGDVRGSMAASQEAIRRWPDNATAESNLLLALSADPETSASEYLAVATRIGDAHGSRIGTPQAFRTKLPPRQRLRIGFVSGDLRSHPVGYFLEPLLSGWDPSRMATVAYSNHPSADALTARLRRRFGAWHDVWHLDDAALASRIVEHGIDVLIDLSGHTPDNRLGVFARRAAPLQLSWLGYWASTGLPTMDAVIADPVSVPPGSDADFRERVLRLPASRLCFAEPDGPIAEPSPPPCLRPGAGIVFGSFQRIAKITDETLMRWRDVLDAVPHSTLRLQSFQVDDPRMRRALLERCARLEFDEARLTLVAGTDRKRYLDAHAEVDIVLDTSPHTGATTTCEALWMGVPTMTVAGRTMLERQGASLLAAAGLGDWVAEDRSDFVRRAARFATDRPALVRLRARLRATVRESPLMDSRAFAGRIPGRDRVADLTPPPTST
jgi:predicted O-linked N-acetylglucosamine transferase (SPINDLY family)